ncbi:hypothetical protein CTI14_53260, partial [Methylobacterium radiotolerans]
MGRLEGLFQDLEQDAGGHTCQAMLGLVKEGEEMIREKAAPAVKDRDLYSAETQLLKALPKMAASATDP